MSGAVTEACSGRLGLQHRNSIGRAVFLSKGVNEACRKRLAWCVRIYQHRSPDRRQRSGPPEVNGWLVKRHHTERHCSNQLDWRWMQQPGFGEHLLVVIAGCCATARADKSSCEWRTVYSAVSADFSLEVVSLRPGCHKQTRQWNWNCGTHVYFRLCCTVQNKMDACKSEVVLVKTVIHFRCWSTVVIWTISSHCDNTSTSSFSVWHIARMDAMTMTNESWCQSSCQWKTGGHHMVILALLSMKTSTSSYGLK